MNDLPIKKIGIIQNAPLAADLSGNLRRIVQGYRECLDHGAQLIIAPATALCGADLYDLAKRPSFIRQQMAAMESLSRELGSVPLILGGYTPLFNGELIEEDILDDVYSGIENVEAGQETMEVSLVPYLLEHDCVSELTEGEVNDIAGMNVYIDTDDDEVYPRYMDFDLLIHLGTAPWYAESAAKDARERLWEAENNAVPVICVHHVGTTEENLYGGGSGVYMPDRRTLARLPFFEESAKVVNLAAGTRAAALPEGVELLALALTRGIRDTVENNGYRGVCVPLDHRNSTLLSVLCVRALGASRVQGVTFEGNTQLSKSLGISCHKVDMAAVLPPVADALGAETPAAMKSRLQGAILSTMADEKGLMLLTPLDRNLTMTGQFTLYGETCGYLAPLGNLYEIDLHMLSEHFAEQYADVFGTMEEPPTPETDRIIHELADLNNSASALLNIPQPLYKENDVRTIQRRIIASALKRSQFPYTLHVDKPAEQLAFPVCHRLND